MTAATDSPFHPLLVLAVAAVASLPCAGDRPNTRAVVLPVAVEQYDGPVPPPPPDVRREE